MAIHGIMLRACSIAGHVYKPPLSSRFFAPFYQQTAGVQTLETKLGFPEKPKKPLSAFILYTQMMRPEIVAQNPALLPSGVLKKMSEQWKTCDPALKQKLYEKSLKNSKEYGIAIQKYYLSLSPEDVEKIREAKAKIKQEKISRKLRMVQKTYNKPKMPQNAFMLFLQLQSTKDVMGSMKQSQKLRKGAELWKNAPEDLVSELRQKAKELRQQYLLDLKAWEEEMVAAGRIDVLHPPESKTKA